MLRLHKITLLLLISIIVYGCSTADDAQRKFEDEAFREPSNFTRTGPSGNIIETDPDDWRIGPLFQGFVEISPAFPNPTSGELITIELLVTGLQALNGLEVVHQDSRGNFRPLHIDNRIPMPTGLSIITFDPLIFADGGTISNAIGLHRVFIFDNRSNLISYGDIMIELTFENEAFSEPSGFTRTGPSGDVSDEDPDDWRIGPLFQGFVEISPAYPNPTTGELVTIEILVTGLQALNGLEVVRLDNRGNFRLLYLDDRIPLPTGLSTITFDPLLFANGGTISNARGLHRVFIFDNRRNLISYGDIMIV